MICQLNSSVASNLGPVRLCVGWGRAGNTKSGGPLLQVWNNSDFSRYMDGPKNLHVELGV